MKLVGATRQALGEFTLKRSTFRCSRSIYIGAALATPENTEALTETIPDFDRLPKSKQHCVKR